MKPKGTQFQQLSLPGIQPPAPAQKSVANSDTRLSDHGQFVQKFGSAPSGSWSWAQEELPHGMPQREYGALPDGDSTNEWVPTWNMETEQFSITPDKFLDRFVRMDYTQKSNQPEGQETGFGINDAPITSRFPGKGADGGDLHVLMDGNHRISAERHRGAMFHRVRSYTGDPENLPKRRPPTT